MFVVFNYVHFSSWNQCLEKNVSLFSLMVKEKWKFRWIISRYWAIVVRFYDFIKALRLANTMN